MHNNGYVNKNRIIQKEFYTVVEAAVLWARADGAKNAGDPRISEKTQIILDAIKSGSLKTANDADKVGVIQDTQSYSLSPTVAFKDLKNWMAEYFPDTKPAFLFKR